MSSEPARDGDEKPNAVRKSENDSLRKDFGNSLICAREFVDRNLYEIRAVNSIVVLGGMMFLFSKVRGVKKYTTALAIPDLGFHNKQKLAGKVVGTTNAKHSSNEIMRVVHSPLFRRIVGWESLPKSPNAIDSMSLKIACFGIDVDKSLADEWIKENLVSRNAPVKLQLVHRDIKQADVAVCKVWYRPNWTRVSLAEKLVREGIAKVSTAPWPSTAWESREGVDDAGTIDVDSSLKLMVSAMKQDIHEIELLAALEEEARLERVGIWKDLPDEVGEEQKMKRGPTIFMTNLWLRLKNLFSSRK